MIANDNGNGSDDNITHAGGRNEPREDCHVPAHKLIRGRYKFRSGNVHFRYNYGYYFHRAWRSSYDSDHRPHDDDEHKKKTIVVIRAEHQRDDLMRLEHLLMRGGGGRGRENTAATTNTTTNTNTTATASNTTTALVHHTHGSESYGLPKHVSATEGHILCCVLIREIQVYHELVQRAINLYDSEKEATLYAIQQRCGIETTAHFYDISQWTAWHTHSCNDI